MASNTSNASVMSNKKAKAAAKSAVHKTMATKKAVASAGKAVSAPGKVVQVPGDTDRYEAFLDQVRDRFRLAASGDTPLFHTDVEPTALWEAYLDGAPTLEARAHRTCNACRKFIERFGGLVTVFDDGSTKSVMWDDLGAPPAYRDAAALMEGLVLRARVTGVFLSSERVLGTPETPPWTHFSVKQSRPFSAPLMNAHQAMALRIEEYGMLVRGLEEFDIETVRKAHAYLTNGSLYRAEKCVSVAKWLLDLHEMCAATKNTKKRDALLWRAVATAPVGFCHVKATMIGTLLTDIASGAPFSAIQASFNGKMNPMQYMRPTALPSAGNVRVAEGIIGRLQTEGSLSRRFATLDDVEIVWAPRGVRYGRKTASAVSEDSVFAGLKTKTPRDASLSSPSPLRNNAPAVVMTWAKFSRDVLPNAERIEYFVPMRNDNFTALVTAANMDAPPILQWDSEQTRNPVSWYVYIGGSSPTNWNLAPGQYVEVTAIVEQPTMWHGASSKGLHAHQGISVNLILKGARDTGYSNGSGLFPECLKSEYHAIRSTLEAHIQRSVIAGGSEAEVCGLRLQKDGGVSDWNAVVAVTAGGVRTTYKLDRWD